MLQSDLISCRGSLLSIYRVFKGMEQCPKGRAGPPWLPKAAPGGIQRVLSLSPASRQPFQADAFLIWSCGNSPALRAVLHFGFELLYPEQGQEQGCDPQMGI